MLRKNYKSLVLMLAMFAISFTFIGGDCGTDSDDDPPPVSVTAPTNVSLKVDANPGGGSLAVVSWTHSTDQGRSDFSRYRVVTYQVDANGNAISVFDVQDNVPKTSTTQIVSSISRGTRYQTFIRSVLTDGTRSDSVASLVYGGVYFSADGVIDQFSSNTNAQSGYGWEPGSGLGTQYSFSSTDPNFSDIDLHMRSDNSNNLLFYSPNTQGGVKTTLLGIVGGGQTNFDRTDLTEPNSSSVQVAEDIVYLLKTQEGNYIKVWVKSISTPAGQNFQRVTFDYKVQPIENLRVVKRR